jgi:hypothetical protein
MARKRRSSTRPKPRRKAAHAREIPQQLSKYMRRNLVDISDATGYFKKSWEVYRPLVAKHVIERSGGRYKLSGAFLKDFLRELRNTTEGHTQLPYKIAGANLVAEMLCWAASARSLAVPDELPSDYECKTDVWPSSRPISEAWARLGRLQVPQLETAILMQSEPGKKWDLGHRWSEEQKVGVSLQFNEDKNALPALALEVVGEPVCLLMRARHSPRDPDERRQDREEAVRLWRSIERWVQAAIRVGELHGGRPATGLGWQAAFLHDHEGLSWAQVARRLCPSQHTHTEACGDNYRKQAEQYWRRIRRQVSRMTSPSR